jgi:hypothetical protein
MMSTLFQIVRFSSRKQGNGGDRSFTRVVSKNAVPMAVKVAVAVNANSVQVAIVQTMHRQGADVGSFWRISIQIEAS